MKRILFDQGVPVPVPVPLRNALVGIGAVKTAYERGWATLKNGELVEVAAKHFDVFVTTDKNLRYQQNLLGQNIAVVVLPTTKWPVLRAMTERIASEIDRCPANGFVEIELP